MLADFVLARPRRLFCEKYLTLPIINLGYYGVFYVLYLTHTITFTMNTIILMFGFGMVVHYAVSVIEEKVFFKRTLHSGQKAAECSTRLS